MVVINCKCSFICAPTSIPLGIESKYAVIRRKKKQQLLIALNPSQKLWSLGTMVSYSEPVQSTRWEIQPGNQSELSKERSGKLEYSRAVLPYL